MLSELNELKQSMEMEVREVAASDRTGCERRLQEYRKDIDALSKDLTRAVRCTLAVSMARQTCI